MTREIGGVVGAVVGFVVTGFNPMGAQAGFMIGSAIGGAIEGPDRIYGPKLADTPLQTSREGVPIPVGWGTVHVRGNIIQVNPTQEVEVVERQGKGGGTETVHYEYYKTFAIGLCRGIDGPITGILRIWENDKLIYDMRDTPAIPVAETQATADKLTIYLGDEAQLPDSELEAHWGVGGVPAYRGLAYVVFNNYDVTNFAAAIPRYAFEVQINGPVPSTTWVYPLEALTKMQIGIAAPTGSMNTIPAEAMDFTIDAVYGSMRQILKDAPQQEEAMDFTIDAISGSMRQILKDAPQQNEAMDFTIDAIDGSMRTALIQIYPAPIRVQIGISAPTGTMTAV